TAAWSPRRAACRSSALMLIACCAQTEVCSAQTIKTAASLTGDIPLLLLNRCGPRIRLVAENHSRSWGGVTTHRIHRAGSRRMRIARPAQPLRETPIMNNTKRSFAVALVAVGTLVVCSGGSAQEVKPAPATVGTEVPKSINVS